MQSLSRWTIETIRKDEAMMSWLEERKFEWVPLVKNTLSHLLEGTAIVVVTDMEREWFCRYIMQNINRQSKSRPIFPFYSIEAIYPQVDLMRGEEELMLLNEMLTLSFRNGYLFWYIGKVDDSRAKIALNRDDSFLWVLDEEHHNSFGLSSVDDLLDLKLLQLFRIFDKTISAALFNQVNLE